MSGVMDSIYVGYRGTTADPNGQYFVKVVNGVEIGSGVPINWLTTPNTGQPDLGQKVFDWNYFSGDPGYGVTVPVYIYGSWFSVFDSIPGGEKFFSIQRKSDLAKIAFVDMGGRRTHSVRRKIPGGCLKLEPGDKLLVESSYIPSVGMTRTLGGCFYYSTTPP